LTDQVACVRALVAIAAVAVAEAPVLQIYQIEAELIASVNKISIDNNFIKLYNI
jgi:hypothetical protein